jgi:hypothetical protein
VPVLVAEVKRGPGTTGRLPGRTGTGRGLAGDLRPAAGTTADPRAHVQRRAGQSAGSADDRGARLSRAGGLYLCDIKYII